MAQEKSYAIERSARSHCSADELLQKILDSTSWPEWQPEIVTTQGPAKVSEGDLVDGRARMLGFNVDGRSYITHVGHDFFEEDAIVGVRMRIRYEVKDDGDGAVVTQHLVASMPSGLAGRVLSFFLRRRLRLMQRAALTELVAQAEASSS